MSSSHITRSTIILFDDLLKINNNIKININLEKSKKYSKTNLTCYNNIKKLIDKFHFISSHQEKIDLLKKLVDLILFDSKYYWFLQDHKFRTIFIQRIKIWSKDEPIFNNYIKHIYNMLLAIQ